jgi:hypothetical protein
MHANYRGRVSRTGWHCCLSFPRKSADDMRHWPPSSIMTDQLGSYPKAITRLQREGKMAPTQSVARASTSITSSKPTTCSQTRHPAYARLSKHEDGGRYDQGLRSHAHDQPGSVPDVQATRKGQSPVHQQAVLCLHNRCLIHYEVTKLRPPELMHSAELSGVLMSTSSRLLQRTLLALF